MRRVLKGGRYLVEILLLACLTRLRSVQTHILLQIELIVITQCPDEIKYESEFKKKAHNCGSDGKSATSKIFYLTKCQKL